MTNILHCDIFCRVIDNYGDVGVCWRLARALRAELGWTVRLICADIAVFAQRRQRRDDVSWYDWSPHLRMGLGVKRVSPENGQAWLQTHLLPSHVSLDFTPSVDAPRPLSVTCS